MKLRTLPAPFALFLLSAFLALPVSTGCAAVAGLLPHVIAAVTDGAQILDAIERFVSSWFVQHPDAEAQKKVAEAITRCRMALNAALRTAQGAKSLNDAQVDAAFDEFKRAYIELLALVRPYGVRESALPSMHMRAAPNELVVPQPVAFRQGAH